MSSSKRSLDLVGLDIGERDLERQEAHSRRATRACANLAERLCHNLSHGISSTNGHTSAVHSANCLVAIEPPHAAITTVTVEASSYLAPYHVWRARFVAATVSITHFVSDVTSRSSLATRTVVAESKLIPWPHVRLAKLLDSKSPVALTKSTRPLHLLLR